MPRPTGRGYALLAVAAATYLAGRVLGTWELYLFAFTFVAILVLGWLMVALSRRRLEITRALSVEQPIDGDEPDLLVTVRNRSLLPSPQATLRNSLHSLSGNVVELELETLAPRTAKRLRAQIGRTSRGVHRLQPVEIAVEDLPGLVKGIRKVGDNFTATVLPRVAFLDSCFFCPEYGLEQDSRGGRGFPTSGATEFRGVRPHQPGEPLSHIDWKSTAKTGVLMLREMEKPTGADFTVLLDGTAAQVQGAHPDTNYELAVRAAGSVIDFVLRSGRDVTLLSHEKNMRQVHLKPDAHGRRILLYTLAEVRADAPGPLVHAVRRLRDDNRRFFQARHVILVSMSLDERLTHALLELRRDGAHVSLLYVVAASWAGLEQPSSGGRTEDLAADFKAWLLALSSAGILCLTVARGEDLSERLTARLREHHAQRKTG